MCAMRILKISGGKYLLWFNLLQQFDSELNILIRYRIFLILSAFVKRQRHKMNVVIFQPAIACSGYGLTLSDQSFYGLNLVGVYLVGLFMFHEVTHITVHCFQFRLVMTHFFGEVDIKFHEAKHIIIPYRCISRGLIGHMNIMLLIYQTDESTAHRDHIIIRVRRKDNGTFFRWIRTLRSLRIICVGLTARPASNGML